MIENPWSKGLFKNMWFKVFRLTTNKSLEIQVYKCSWELFGLLFSTKWRGEDHIGPFVEFTLFTYTTVIKLCDNRHWDYINNRWEPKEQ